MRRSRGTKLQRTWTARSWYRALVAARDEAWRRMGETAALGFMPPWLVAEVETMRAILGNDDWSYGLASNEKALATLIGCSHAQG